MGSTMVDESKDAVNAHFTRSWVEELHRSTVRIK